MPDPVPSVFGEISLAVWQESLLDASIRSIYQENSNRYWFGKNGNGIFLYEGDHVKQYGSGWFGRKHLF